MATNLGVTFYEDEVNTGLWEGLAQNIDAFNAASGGSLVLEGGAGMGRKPVRTFWDDIAGHIQSRDPASTSTLTPSVLTDSEHRRVKVYWSAPVDFYDQQFEDTGLGTPEGSRIVGRQLADGLTQKYLNTAIAALVGAINAIGSSAIFDASTTPAGTGTLNFSRLNSGLAKFGDARSSLRTLVTHSVPHANLIDQAFTQQTIAFQVGGTVIFNGATPSLGLRQLVTDSAVLTEDEASSFSNAATNYFTLLLAPGAARIKTGPFRSALSRVIGDASATPQNMKWRFLAESSFEIEVKGVSYKSGSTNNPTDANLSTSSNWEVPVSDRKFGPGVLIKTDG